MNGKAAAPADRATAPEPHARSCTKSDVDGQLSEPAAVDPIATLRPWESETTLALRRRLSKAAFYSAARATRTGSPHARAIFWTVNEVAGAWTFASASDEQMHDVLHGLNLLCCGADAFERNGSGL